MKYWEIKAKADKKTGELILYGDISSASFWGDEITPKKLDEDLKALGDIETLNIYINSGGGSVFAGQAIYNIIKRHGATCKNAYIDGLAASIASVIVMACHKVVMPKNAMMMIHNPWGVIAGDAEKMRKSADTLDTLKETLVNVYEEKTGQSREKIADMMNAETWMTAQEAKDLGFIDEIEADKVVSASIDGDFLTFGETKVNLSGFKNFNPGKLEMYRGRIKEPEPVANRSMEQDNEFRRIKNKILGGF